MLPIKSLVAFIAVCVTCVVSGEYTNSVRPQDQLILPDMPKATEVYASTPIKTPRPEILSEGTGADVLTLTETPCPHLPVPTDTEPNIEDLTKETPVHEKAETYSSLKSTPAPTAPCPVFTLVPETEALQNEEMTTPAPTTPWSTFELASKTKARQNEEIPETNPSLTSPFPTLTLASETEASPNEKTIKTYSTRAPTIPCPTFTLVPEMKALQTDEMNTPAPTTLASTHTHKKKSSKPYTPAVTDAPLPSLTEVPAQTDAVAMVMTDETTESGDIVEAGSKMTDASTTDTADAVTTDDGVTTEELSDAYSNASKRNLRSN